LLLFFSFPLWLLLLRVTWFCHIWEALHLRLNGEPSLFRFYVKLNGCLDRRLKFSTSLDLRFRLKFSSSLF
jgi:hypothetical protein